MSTLDSFKDIFKLSYLKSIEERVAVYRSEAGDGLKSFDGISGESVTKAGIEARLKKYQAIANETIIRFLESNKEQFMVEESVRLTLELKNVSVLYIKVFEFNTETYYLKNRMPFNPNVNLDGMIATIERQVETFKDKPSTKKY